MSDVELIRSPHLTDQAPYAYAAAVPAGRMVFTAGAELADVAKSTVFVASGHRDDLVAAWDVVARHFGDHDAPSTLLGVAVLGYPHQLVEVEAVAVVQIR